MAGETSTSSGEVEPNTDTPFMSLLRCYGPRTGAIRLFGAPTDITAKLKYASALAREHLSSERATWHEAPRKIA